MKRAALAVALALFVARSAEATRVVVLDDGEKIARGLDRPLQESAWPEGPVALFALRGETVAFQVVIEATERPLRHVHASLSSAHVAWFETFAEGFVHVERATGNDRDPASSLAFSRKAAPPAEEYIGDIADPLFPRAAADVDVGQRGAVWIDVAVPDDAPPETSESILTVTSDGQEIARLSVRLRVLDDALPFAAAKATVYYDTVTLERRMGDAAPRAESQLRRLLHAHHLSAVHERTDPSPLAKDDDALTGALFTRERGYTGPGQGVGEGVFAIGAYGTLGDPSPESVKRALAFAARLRELGVEDRTRSFVYAVDEDCRSPRPRAWRFALGGRVPVGATCGDDPATQAADLVMMTSDDYHPSRARAANAVGKEVWVYNGQRPFAGPMMLDVPATDLRANAWIAMRYGVARWFYWESAYWLDGGKGGRGDGVGFDPFVVAETFHNADGDHANGDGILVYPGTQRGAPGMRDYGSEEVFPSVRLKNLRRGIEDAGYIALARAIDPDRADEIVRRMVPRALALAGERASWSERGTPWLEARRRLAAILVEPPTSGRVLRPPVSMGCGIAPARSSPALAWLSLGALACAFGCARRRASGRPAALAQACLLARPRLTERLVAVGAEREVRRARVAVEDAPLLERLEARLTVTVPGRVTRARLLHPAARAHAERMLLHELGELVADAAEGRDAAAATERARRREARVHGGADELALVGHRVEEGREIGLHLEGDDVLCRTGLPGHGVQYRAGRRHEPQARERAQDGRKSGRCRGFRRASCAPPWPTPRLAAASRGRRGLPAWRCRPWPRPRPTRSPSGGGA